MVRQVAARITTFGADGAQLRQSEELPAGEFLSRGGGGMPRPLAPQLVFAALPNGQLAFGTGSDSSVSILEVSGVVRRVVLPLHHRPVRPADLAAANDAMLTTVPPQVRDRVRQMLATAPLRTTLPFYRGMQSQPDGTLWLDTSAPGDAAMEWTIVRSNRITGTVRLPVSGKVLALTADRIVILSENTEGEQVVGVYAVGS
jgi:hypothetical protein